MMQSLSLKQTPVQTMNLRLIMQSAVLFDTPGAALDSVINAIALNPEGTDNILRRNKNSEENRGGIKAVFADLNENQNSQTPKSNGGIIVSPKLEELVGVVGESAVVNLTPDVSYRGRKNEFPEIEFASYLKERPELSLLAIPSRFADAQRLYTFLLKEREWIGSKIRTIGEKIGDKQRDYLATLNPTDLHLFSYTELAEELDLNPSTVFRLYSKRSALVESTDGKKEIHPFRHLLANQYDMIRFNTIAGLNQVLASEPELGTAYSDEDIARKTRTVRRTITKYRTEARIPISKERAEFYSRNPLTRFSIPYFGN